MDVQMRVSESARALAGWRGDRGAEVALILGLAKSTAASKLAGKIPWTVADMDKLCKHYGVTFDQLTAGPASWLGIKSSSNELTPPYVYANAA